MSAMYRKSEIDEFFYRLMGYYPKRAGEAFEQISTAALGIIKGQLPEHNVFLNGLSGGRPYQIDGLLNKDVMVESKDYTIDNRKVGRPDLQKMQGALSDLPQIKEGFFTSATDYSRDAIKYAKGTEINNVQKEITTIDVRPSTPEDEKGRVKTIILTLQYLVPDFNRGKKSINFAEGGKEMLLDYMKKQKMAECPFRIEMLFDKDGKPLISIQELSRKHQPPFDDNTEYVSGEFPVDAYIKFYDILIPIKGITYNDVPIVKGQETITIEADGNASLLIKSDKLGINKLITDNELRSAIAAMGK